MKRVTGREDKDLFTHGANDRRIVFIYNFGTLHFIFKCSIRHVNDETVSNLEIGKFSEYRIAVS